MLAVQVAWLNYKETQRHDLVTEKETAKHNRTTERLGFMSLDEEIRHNKAQEQYWQDTLVEQSRHNRVTESQGWTNIDISRENAQSMRLQAEASLAQAAAAQRNAATNEWNARANYSLGLEANKIADYNAETNRTRMHNDFVLGFSNADVNERSVGVSQQNADTARMSQLTNEERLSHDKKMDVWHNVNDSVDKANKVADTALGAVGFSSSIGGH